MVCWQRTTTLTKPQEKREARGVQQGALKCDWVEEHRESYGGKADPFPCPVPIPDRAAGAPACFGEDVLFSGRVIGLGVFLFWPALVFPVRVFLLVWFRAFLCFFLL